MLFFGGMIGAHVPEWTAEDNLQFLKDHMGVTMPERKIQRYIYLLLKLLISSGLILISLK
jgi:hypothetical protein